MKFLLNPEENSKIEINPNLIQGDVITIDDELYSKIKKLEDENLKLKQLLYDIIIPIKDLLQIHDTEIDDIIDNFSDI